MSAIDKRLLLAMLLVVGLVVYLSSPVTAEAGTFVVNTINDTDDGACDSSHCSLREAVNAANANPGPDTIQFDIPGSAQETIVLENALPPLIDDGTVIDGTTEPDYAGLPQIYIHKAAASIEVGLAVDSNGNTIRGLGLVGFGTSSGGASPNSSDLTGGAIVISGSNNLIQQNFIGSGAWWNMIGVRIHGPGNSVIANVISGNVIGIYSDQPNTVIQSNIIGPGADGITAVHNDIGILLALGSDNSLIGGSSPGEGNLISANQKNGLISNSNNNQIYGNLLGLDASGTAALPNGWNAMTIVGENTIIGGPAPGQGNVISGNSSLGIWINDTGNVIQGNKIGTDITGSIAIPNGSSGIESEAAGLTIGGSSASEGNLIMGNTNHGVYIDDLALDNLVANNTIRENGGAGIALTYVHGNTFSRNSIFQNGDLGIRTNGYNQNIQPPTLSISMGSSINGAACPNCIVEIFSVDPDPTGSGEGEQFLGSGTADGNGEFSIPIQQTGLCTLTTATATDANGNTSEFASNIKANCLHLGPFYLIPIWSFVVVVFAAVPVLIRRQNPSLSGWFVPIGALVGALIFLPVVQSLPFVDAQLMPPSSTCGDGIVEGHEQCDLDDLTLCRSDQICADCQCVLEIDEPICGDGDVDGSEQCDGDDLSLCQSGQICQDCECATVAGFCGDGRVNDGEECDGDDLSACLSDQICQDCQCTDVAGTCGDGVVNEGEQCDGGDLSQCESGQACESCQCISPTTAATETCVYAARVNTNCRESDYVESEQVGILLSGDTAELLALNPEYTHGYFSLADGTLCWIWLGSMDGEENPLGSCKIDLIDPAEPSPVCSSDLDEEQCVAVGGEYISATMAGEPRCVCPE